MAKITTQKTNNVNLQFAEKHSNNIAECIAITKALKWIKEQLPKAKKVDIYYDSEYAASTMTGYYKTLTNPHTTLNLKTQYNVTKQHFNIKTHYVKGHSNNKWNDLADTLANKGRMGNEIEPLPPLNNKWQGSICDCNYHRKYQAQECINAHQNRFRAATAIRHLIAVLKTPAPSPRLANPRQPPGPTSLRLMG